MARIYIKDTETRIFTVNFDFFFLLDINNRVKNLNKNIFYGCKSNHNERNYTIYSFLINFSFLFELQQNSSYFKPISGFSFILNSHDFSRKMKERNSTFYQIPLSDGF